MDRKMSSANDFMLFGQAHVVAMAVIVVVSVGLPLAVDWSRSAPVQRFAALMIAFLLVGHEIFRILLRTEGYGHALAPNLPLHLCGVSIFLGAVMLVGRVYRIFEIVYFWGLAGTVQAILTPELIHGFPHPLFITFFISHGLVIVCVFFALIVFRYRPTHGSIWKAFAATAAYAVLITPFNIALGTNYLFLMHKPVKASLLDYLGPWPWYIGSLAVVGIASFYIYYVPFWVGDRLRWRVSHGRFFPLN